MRQMVLTARLALRNLARNQRRTLLTAMIISLSLAALVFTDGLVQAMSDTMVRAATRLYAGDAQIHHRDYRASRDEADTIAEPERLLARLAQAEGVAAQTPRALAMGMISSAANNRAVQVVGVDPEREAGVSRLADAIVSGDYLAADGAETQLLIGRRLAELLEAEIGERIVVSVSNQQSGTA